MTDNYFSLTHPERLRCQMYRYYSGLSRLYVSVSKSITNVPAFFLLFSDVAYVDVPVNWQSAAFRIAPHTECIDLLLATGVIGPAVLQFPDAYAAITDNAQLFVVDPPRIKDPNQPNPQQRPVRIIAGNAVLLPDLPGDLR
jgi:hypothetical protein